MNETTPTLYNRAKTWQIGLFSLNSMAVNLYTMLFMYIVYFASGLLGVGVALVATILMTMNIFDGITDPVVGWLIDRTNGRYGKFRPFMVVGNAIMAFSLFLIYISQYAGGVKVSVFIASYIVFIIGFSFQFCVTRAGLSALTNDPKQRPLYSVFDMITNILLFVGVGLLVSNYLIVKHGDFTGELFGSFFLMTATVSAVCTLLAVIGIWEKDRQEFFGLAEKTPKVKLLDGWKVMRHNRSVRLLIISAATDRLASNVSTNAVVMVILFGIVCGNFALSGQLNLYVFVPVLIISLLCIQYARMLGQKEAFLFGTYGGILFTVLIFLLFLFGDPTTLSFTHWGTFTILFLVFMAFRGGFMSVTRSIIVPMISDCADYEVVRSGKYLPGMIGAMFTFADKVVNSLTNVIVAGLLITVGYRAYFPTVNTPYTPALFWVAMICFCGIPILSWLINIICMKYYPLTKEKMKEVQEEMRMMKGEK